jgi:hypothetical protein
MPTGETAPGFGLQNGNAGIRRLHELRDTDSRTRRWSWGLFILIKRASTGLLPGEGDEIGSRSCEPIFVYAFAGNSRGLTAFADYVIAKSFCTLVFCYRTNPNLYSFGDDSHAASSGLGGRIHGISSPRACS